MINLFIHGLGQNNKSWDTIKNNLKSKNIDIISPNIIDLLNNNINTNIFTEFENFCNIYNEKINLCGLSLGALLALEYTKKYPNKVNSLILIASPFKISKFIFMIQTIIFYLMPERTFKKIGYTKKSFIKLANSIKYLNISKNIEKINCKTLILCGENDKVNKKCARELNKNIKNSNLKFIKNSGHEVNIEKPNELSDIIYNFYNK